MSNCWKCGRELPEGQTECEYGCDDTSEAVAQLEKDIEEKYWDFNFSKITTFEELKAVLAHIHMNEGIFSDHEDFSKLKHLCDPPRGPQDKDGGAK